MDKVGFQKNFEYDFWLVESVILETIKEHIIWGIILILNSFHNEKAFSDK